MKLSKQDEKDLIQVYDSWWHSYLNGDVKTYDSYFAEDYRFIGSTNNEDYLNRKDTTKFFEDTSEQLAGKAELRNLERTINVIAKDLVLVTDLGNGYVLSNSKWVFYSRFRFTSLIKKTKEGWRFTYQHFSAPDNKAQEGETLGTEQISKENRELRDAIKRRTVELEQSNRELAIEAALERVRSRSMGMHKSEELKEVIKVVYEQLVQLGFKIEHAGFIIDYKKNDDMHIWLTDQNEIPSKVVLPYFDCAHWNSFNNAKAKGINFFTNHLDFKEKNKFYKDLFKLIADVPKETLEYYRKCPGLAISTALLDNIGLYIENFEGIPYSEKENDILMRFGNVFQQTYTRFLDLEMAEAQAREAKIETALEKVRTQAMGMQTSKDLSMVTNAMFEQLRLLGGELFATGIVFCDKHENHVEQWHSIPKAGMMSPFIVPINLDYIHQYRYDQWKKGTELFSIEIPSDFIEQHFNDIFELPSAQVILKEFEANKTPMPPAPDWEIDYGASFNHGYLLVSALQPFEEAEILPRFAKVFEQTYTRFLDLQKAEAQAREAQIETALERVRSRTIAMQNSDELREASFLLDEQVRGLGIKTWGCAFNIYGEKESTEWFGNEAGVLPTYKVPRAGIFKEYYQQGQKGESLLIKEFSGDECVTHYEYMSSLPIIGDVLKNLKETNNGFPTYQIDHVVYFKYGYLLFITREHVPEAHDIFKRFAKVFEQTYTRFLDLQKAEAQAREAQIEASLERVRAQSMGMHSSQELKDVIRVIFDQMGQININAEHAGIVVNYEPKKDWHFWVAETQDIPAKITVPYLDSIWDRQFTEAKQNNKALFTTLLNFEEKNAFYKKLLPHIEGLTKEMEDHYFKSNGLAASTALQKDIGLYIENFSGTPYTNEENSILLRFAKVFQQTYTRFLDLQKAETQAREAQIEMSLERVRARAMAMHHTDELTDVLCVLFDQFDFLGINPVLTHLTLMDEENETFQLRITSSAKNRVVADQYIDVNAVEAWRNSFANWKNSAPNTVDCIDYEPSMLPDVWELLKEVMDALPKGHKIYPKDFPEGLYTTQGHFKFGYIGFNHSRRATEEEKSIVERFAREFGRTYQRFLDLQKAEAQARESQIEAALEKVRSRSLAMHVSTEMQEVANEIREQLLFLGLKIDALAMSGVIDNESDYDVWVGGANSQKPLRIPYNNDTQVQRDFNKAIKERPELFTKTYKGKVMKAYFKHLMASNSFNPEIEHFMLNCNAFTTTLTFMKNSGIQIIRYNNDAFSDEDNTIVKRFGKVFEQAYIRFLDLQKAEQQAKEAQIENALEKVRSRTMAMQKSEELPEAANNLFLQLQELGLPAWSAGYCIWQDEKKNASCNMSTEGLIQKSFILPSIGEGYDFYTPSLSDKSFHIHELGGEALVKHYEFMITLPVVGEILDGIIKSGLSLPTFQIFHIVYFKYGYVMFITYESMPHAHDIFKRFGKVFEQTYTRFLDLQKAEAQTRDAQINLAVERVRAKALAMHKSEEIINVVAKLKDEVMSLDIPDVVAATIFLNEGDDKVRMWDLSSIEVNDNHSEIPFDLTFKIKKTDPHFYVKRVWENPADYFVEIQDEKGFKRLMQWLRELDKNKKEVADEVEDFIEKTQLKRLYHVVRKLNNGKLVIDLLNPPSNEMETILTKMGAAFDLAYKRFEDLKKAEAQTKEARIEAALERVRSRSMAMHKSEELLDVISVVSEQLIQLDFKFIHVSFANNDISKDYKFWTAYKGMVKPIRFNTPYLDIAIFNNLRKAQKNSMAFFTDILTNEEHIQWHQHLLKHGGSKIFSKEENDYIMSRGMARSIAINPNIMLILANYASIPYSEEENKIISRFGKVFEQSYTRFLDLQKAESQAKETEIELALERIRARTMAMHKSSELGEVAAVLFEQISTLNDIPSRFNIAIINEEDKTFDIWLTDQSGKNVNQQFIFHSDKSPVVNEIFKAWKTKKNHIIQDLHGKKLEEWIRYSSIEVGVPFDKSQVKKHRYISSICFKNGFIGITTDVHPEQDEIQLLERFTKVFEQTYTRFLDLEKAEAQAMIAEQNLINLKTEKKRAEDALKELQHTQKQLIQSEKMASLGELTAGIAHEIQNPLNFVNNFSEVSTELIDEMSEEIEKGDLEEVKFIMADIKLNLEKINHHGRRADAIVKGMLQHSRTSSAKKEPTDINKLADEYFRLAYHGLRAKDKTFNATLETAYDKTIGKISVIPQDMGRVILNLITNAFYVVDEKKKSGIPNYEPTVTLSTKKQKNKITVSVKDNGKGIPKNALDKIFQPFFTTKPTGQGTGLGLSMSYDIVTKGHNGELKAKTEQDVGSEFIISLPI